LTRAAANQAESLILKAKQVRRLRGAIAKFVAHPSLRLRKLDVVEARHSPEGMHA
jgi:hypothetical protein